MPRKFSGWEANFSQDARPLRFPQQHAGQRRTTNGKRRFYSQRRISAFSIPTNAGAGICR